MSHWAPITRLVPLLDDADVPGNPGAAGDTADGPGSAVPVQPPPVAGQEERSLSALADSQVDRPGEAGKCSVAERASPG